MSGKTTIVCGKAAPINKGVSDSIRQKDERGEWKRRLILEHTARKMRIGILGCGGMGRVHAKHYSKMDDVELFGFDVDEERLAEFCKSGNVTPVKSQEELFNQSQAIDACLPTHLHFPVAADCIKAGKPLLLEKPMCRSLRECAELVELSETHGVPIMVAHVVRYFAEFRKARDLVTHGTIGTPAAIRTRRGGKFPHGGTTWFAEFSKSGGILLDLLIHDFDWIRWTFGDVERIFAQSLTFSGHAGLDYALVTLTLESGAIAHCEGSWADPGGFRTGIEVCGSGGMIEWDSRNTQSLRTNLFGSSSTESPLSASDDPYFLQLRDFIDAVKHGKPMPVTAQDGAMAVAIAEAAIESCRSGRAVCPSKL